MAKDYMKYILFRQVTICAYHEDHSLKPLNNFLSRMPTIFKGKIVMFETPAIQ